MTRMESTPRVQFVFKAAGYEIGGMNPDPDIDRPSRGPARAVTGRGHGGHAVGDVTKGRDCRPSALQPGPRPYVFTRRS